MGRYKCPSCGMLLALEPGTTRRCPCGKCVKAPGRQRKSSAISSMDAATRTGLVFVGPKMGGGVGSASGTTSKESEYKPNVIAPNPMVQQVRQAFQVALGERQDYWQQELQRLLKTGDASLETALRLAKELGIQFPHMGI